MEENKLTLFQTYETTVIPEYTHPFLNISPVTRVTLNSEIKIEASHMYTFNRSEEDILEVECKLIINIPNVDNLTASTILNQIKSADTMFVTMYVQRHVDLIKKSLSIQPGLNYVDMKVSSSFDILPGQNPLTVAIFAATQPSL
jgi:hypothetical protein